MPISKSDLLFSLIKSLTRGEKRHFRSYAQREAGGSALLYLQLFDILDKQNVLDEKLLATLFAKGQLPNLKRHLYSQVMVSLRLQQQKENRLIQVREYLDFANILYGKGLYIQSLKIIEKAKGLAEKLHDELVMLELLEFEKVIESRHITRSGTKRVETLTTETESLMVGIQNRLKNSNLRLLLHGYYIKFGHVRSNDDAQDVRKLYSSRLDEINVVELGLLEKAYYYQSRVWFHFILLEFEDCLKYAQLWLALFREEDKYLHRDTNLRMRAYHYILTCLYHLGDEEAYMKCLTEFENYRKTNYGNFNKNSQVISFIYVHNGRLNNYILTKEYNKGVEIIPKTVSRLRRYAKILDSHRILVLHYKISLLYIMAGKPDKAIGYLHGIMSKTMDNLREDIQGYARLAFLMAHFDMENYDVVASQIKTMKRHFEKSTSIMQTPQILLTFFEKASNAPAAERNTHLATLKKQIEQLSKNMFEQRGLLYLNVKEWAANKR